MFRLFVLFLLAGCPAGMQAQFLYWDYHNIVDDISLSGAYPDMVIDPTGKIHVSYWHAEEDRLIYASRAAGASAWTREYVDATHANGFRSAIAVDAAQVPHIVFQENDNFKVQMRYAKRSPAGVWTVEQIPGPSRGWGDYGPNGVNTNTERIKHSLDIVIDENQQPQVIFFDGWMAGNAFPICTPSSQYGFKLHQAMRASTGVWTERSFGVVPDIRLSCGFGGSDIQLPAGDRYGEYCALVQRKDNTMDAYMLSRFNYRILNFQNTAPNQDTLWTLAEVDSLTRALYTDSAGVSFFDRYFTWEGISAAVGEDDDVHLAYTGSVFYGENFCCLADFNALYYVRIKPDTVIYHSFGTGTYRNFTDIRTLGSDSIFFSFVNLSTGHVLLESSLDGGLTWDLDTIRSGPSSSRSPLSFLGDSLVVLSFLPEKDQLVLYKRHLAGGPWREEVVNASDFSGSSIDGYLHAAADTVLSTFYSNRYSGELSYAQAGTTGGFNFNPEVLAGATGVSLVAADRRANGQALVAYVGGSSQSLQLAYGQPGNWNYAAIDTLSQVLSLDMQVSSQDSVHIAYRHANSNCLYHLRGHVTGGGWTRDTVDCDSLVVGEFVSLQLDANSSPCIAYYSSTLRSLKYAARGAGGWLIDSVNGGGASAIGKYNSLRLDAAGQPKIAYLDEQATTVMLSERNAAGVWVHTEVDSVPITNIGRPIELELDGFGNVWVAYNYFSNFEKVKLMHRDTIWREVAVGNAGQLANAFFFRITGGDLYLTGRKNQLQNTGVAMLRAANGVFVQAEPPLPLRENVQLSQAPNPFSATTTFTIQVQQADRFSLGIYDLCGRPVAQLFEGQKLVPGRHSFEWQADGLTSGIYFYRLSSHNGQLGGKMILNR